MRAKLRVRSVKGIDSGQSAVRAISLISRSSDVTTPTSRRRRHLPNTTAKQRLSRTSLSGESSLKTLVEVAASFPVRQKRPPHHNHRTARYLIRCQAGLCLQPHLTQTSSKLTPSRASSTRPLSRRPLLSLPHASATTSRVYLPED